MGTLSKNSDIFFSVIITTYKRYNLLKEAIESVITQTYKNYELIVVDDNTEIDESFYGRIDSKYQLLKTAGQCGGSYSRNLGLSKAKGDFVSFLDDDDIWHKQRLEIMNRTINHSDIFVNSYISDYFNKCRIIKVNTNKLFDIKTQQLYADQLVPTSAFTVRRSILEKIGGFDESLPARQDYSLLLRSVQLTSKISYSLEPLTYLRRLFDGNSISSSYKNNLYGTARLYSYIKRIHSTEHKSIRASHQLYIGVMICNYGDVKKGRRFILQSLINDFGVNKLIKYIITFTGRSIWRQLYILYAKLHYKEISLNEWLDEELLY